MKKVLLIIALFCIATKSYSIIFYQPYPITAVVGVNGNKQRIECSVYDSTLHSWQYYNSHYTNDSIVLHAQPSTIILFETMNATRTEWDSIYGYIIYDQVLHQFMPNFEAHADVDFSGATLRFFDNVVNITLWSRYTYNGHNGQVVNFEAAIYNQLVHKWVTRSIASANYDYNETASMDLARGGLLYSYYNDDFNYGPISSCSFFDPILGSFQETSNRGSFIYGDQDVYWGADYYSQTGVFAAFDPGLHTWQTFSALETNGVSINNGIFHAFGGFDQYFGIYDDSLHHWLIDYHLDSYSTVYNVKIKDKVIAYQSDSMVHYQVFSPSSRTWVKDSAQTNGVNALSIVEGTVRWTDNNGVPHKAGYNDATGWGNFNTPLLLNFHITDFYNSDGYPLIFVRDYSIGTDSIWYDFGDGITTQPGKQHSLWHLVKMKKHCANAPLKYTVCIKANTSKGLRTKCKTVTVPCSVDVLVNPVCNSICNGSAITTKMTGAKPISYLWSNGNTASQNNSLCAGNYSVTITNHAGCSVHKNFKITELKTTIATTDNYCNGGCKGTATVNVSDGFPPYSFLWSNGQTTDQIENLCTGTYTVTVTDARQCASVITDSIKEVNVFRMTYRQTRPVYCDVGGNIHYQFIGGLPPFTAISDHGLNINIDFNTGNYPDGVLDIDYGGAYYYPLPAGIYITTISDASGCTFVMTDTLPPPPPITSFALTGAINPTCQGVCNGYFTFTVTGGTPPYELGDTTGVNMGCAGLHYIKIADARNCLYEIMDTMSLIDPPSTNFHITTTNYSPTCNGCANGAIKVVFSGGTPPYTIHSWYPTTGILSVPNDSLYRLKKGIYEINVHDAMSCTTYVYDTLKVVTPRLSQNEQEDNSIWISPNPASNQFMVHDDALQIKSVEIFNAVGEIVYIHSPINDNQLVVNCEKFSPGIYFIKMKTETGSEIKKLFIE